jgi:hypothetical protein
VLGVIELLNVEGVVLELDDCPLVVIDIAVVWSAEDGDDDGKVLTSVPPVHFVAIHLGFVCPDH